LIDIPNIPRKHQSKNGVLDTTADFLELKKDLLPARYIQGI